MRRRFESLGGERMVSSATFRPPLQMPFSIRFVCRVEPNYKSIKSALKSALKCTEMVKNEEMVLYR
jgi:hypothetical protein